MYYFYILYVIKSNPSHLVLCDKQTSVVRNSRSINANASRRYNTALRRPPKANYNSSSFRNIKRLTYRLQ